MQFSFFSASIRGCNKVSDPVAAPLGLANHRVVVTGQPSGFDLGLNAQDRGVVVSSRGSGDLSSRHFTSTFTRIHGWIQH